MFNPIFLPLQGPGGERPKAPSANAWQSPTYEGVDLDLVDPNGWYGLRCDGLVVIDCDSADAAKEWTRRVGAEKAKTWVRKTPRGFHFIYKYTPGSPDGPRVGVFGKGSHIDVRAGRTSQIVYWGEGYYDIDHGDINDALFFDPSWVPSQREMLNEVEEWEEMPEGVGNNTMAAFAGALRRQGMAESMIYKVLYGINKLTMTVDPMPADMIAQIAHSVSRYEPAPDVEIEIAEDEDAPDIAAETTTTVVPADDRLYFNAKKMLVAEPPQWWWQPYLPKGRLVMLDGVESIGKGMFCVWAAKTVASHDNFPGGEKAEPARVLWYTAEDDPHEDVLRRLLAAGYDQERDEAIYFRNPRAKRLTYPNDINTLRDAIVKSDIKLVIMDPGRSFLAPPMVDGKPTEMSFNNEASLRPGLEALMYLAHDLGVTIIFVHHWNKIQHGTTREKMGGSAAFLQVVRHRVSLAQVGERHALGVEKSNITDRVYSVRSYDLEEVPEWDTAKFKLGGALHEYRDLDSWIDTMEKLEGDAEIIIAADDWEDAAWQYSYLQPGELAPTRENIAKDLAIPAEEARVLYAVLVDRGVIDKQKRWVGQPAGNRRRPPIEHDEEASLVSTDA